MPILKYLASLFRGRSGTPRDPLARLDGGQPPEFPALNELVQCMRERGAPVLCAGVESSRSSALVSERSGQVEPALTVYLERFNAEEELLLREDDNWSGHYPRTREIQKLWVELCQREGMEREYYSDDMFVFVYNAKAARLERLVYDMKAAVERDLNERTPQPRYVFASTLPGYSIFFSTATELEEERAAGQLVVRHERIEKLLASADRYGCFASGKVKVRFLDVQSNSRELGLLARED